LSKLQNIQFRRGVTVTSNIQRAPDRGGRIGEFFGHPPKGSSSSGIQVSRSRFKGGASCVLLLVPMHFVWGSQHFLIWCPLEGNEVFLFGGRSPSASSGSLRRSLGQHEKSQTLGGDRPWNGREPPIFYHTCPAPVPLTPWGQRRSFIDPLAIFMGAIHRLLQEKKGRNYRACGHSVYWRARGPSRYILTASAVHFGFGSFHPSVPWRRLLHASLATTQMQHFTNSLRT